MNPLTNDNPKSITRQYTPISSDYSAVGYFDLIVKVYRKNELPQFPEGGWMSQYLADLPIGGQLDCRGPCGRIEYQEKGRFRLGQVRKRYKHVAMIAGGTGITPMFQLINHVLKTREGEDNLKLSLLFGNRCPGDIILRKELEILASGHKNQFKLTFTVDQADSEEHWRGFVGFVTKDMIKAALPAANPNILVLLCGPPPMMKSVTVALRELGHSQDDIYQF
jgi:cytochrome-b5 reductase